MACDQTPFLSHHDVQSPQTPTNICTSCPHRSDCLRTGACLNEYSQGLFTAALNAGKTISQICWGKIGKRKIEGHILSFRKLKLYRQLNPDFDRFVLATTVDNNSKGQQRRYHPNKARIEVIRTEINDYHKIRAMIPSSFPDRDDIVSRIFESLLDGSLRPDAVTSRIKQYITEHNRMFPTKFAKFGDSPLYSLDEVLFDDGSATRGDAVSRGLWD